VKRVCYIGSDAKWGLNWMAACGRYRRSVPSGIKGFVVEECTDDPTRVNCRACWRTRFWRDAIGLTQAKSQSMRITRVHANRETK
jgi:hypothetical protein